MAKPTKTVARKIIERDADRLCRRCLGTMPTGRTTSACDRCDGKKWMCIPQVVVADADAHELAKMIDVDELEAHAEESRRRPAIAKPNEEKTDANGNEEKPKRRSVQKEGKRRRR